MTFLYGLVALAIAYEVSMGLRRISYQLWRLANATWRLVQERDTDPLFDADCKPDKIGKEEINAKDIR